MLILLRSWLVFTLSAAATVGSNPRAPSLHQTLEQRFKGAYGANLPWTRQSLEDDGGQSILNFITSVGQAARAHQLDKAVKMIQDIVSFSRSSVWCLPRPYRTVITITDAISQENISSAVNSEVREGDPTFSYGSLHHAVWPELVIRLEDGRKINLEQATDSKFDKFKIYYILLASEELAHAAQHSRNYLHQSISNFMISLGRSIIPLREEWREEDAFDHLMDARLWPEKDVYAFLIEAFGREVVPKSLVHHYHLARWEVFKHFYPEEAMRVWDYAPTCSTALVEKQARPAN